MAGMMRVRTAAVEADLAALKLAAERAGSALACLFSSSAEFEADVIRVRRAQGAYRHHGRRRERMQRTALCTLLVLTFLLI
jgi:hypothetical protein